MKRNLLKTLLMMVAVICFPLSTFAEETTLKPVQTTVIKANGASTTNEETVFYKTDATAWRCSQSKVSGNAFSNTLSTDVGSPVVITKFNASEFLTGKNLKKATLKFYSRCTVSGKNSNVQIAHIGTGWDATTATWANTNNGDILKAVQISAGTGTNVKTTKIQLTQDVTEQLAASTDGTIGFGIYTYTAREQEITDITLTIEAVDASASSTYTIKYVDGEGNELKASETRSESIGSAAAITDADKAAIYNEDKTKKYIYASDDAEGKTVAGDASTVVTITFREAAIWNYTINAVDGNGNLLKTLKQGTNFEAETFDVAYAAYLNVEGTIYKSSKLSSDKKGYYFSMTLNKDNLSKDVTFTASDITDVVYFSEAEDIEGLTLTNNSNTFIRSSNGASAYAAESDVAFTSLPKGKYKLTAVICDVNKNAGSSWNFKAGDNSVFQFTVSTVNWEERTSGIFELEETTDIVLAQGGSKNQGVDLIYIVHIPDDIAVSVTDAGLATYCPSYGLDFTNAENIAAYKASVNGNEVTLTKVTTVAKGEGVLLRSINGGAAEENIAVNVDATKNNGNAFVGTSKDITVNETAGDKTNYVLSKENDVMGFYKAKAEADGGTKVAAGKAYLPVLTSDAAKGIKVVFDGETTGISTVKDNTVKDNTIYNLNGQRVAAPAKGLYIMNGKKVVIK